MDTNIDKSIEHPGWGVQFEDGTWLDNAYGWFPSKEPFRGDIYSSEEEAKKALNSIDKDPILKEWKATAKIVPAWQILCEKMRVEILILKKANSITPSDISDIVSNLEDAISILKFKR